MAWQARMQKKRPQQTWEEGIQEILQKSRIERNGVRAECKTMRDGKLFVNPLNLLAEEVPLK
jgi:hypothetical protein